jgi:sugar phosphate permease
MNTQKEKSLLIVIGLFLAYGYYNTLRGAFPLQMRNVAKELNIPVARIGLPSSVFSAFYGIGKFYGSILTDYLPCAECHTLGVLLCGLNLAAVGMCRDISSISAMWGLQGLLQALGWPFLSRIVFDKLAKEDRAKYWGVLSMAGSVGSMLAPYSAVLANTMGLSWRGALRMMGASSALVTLLVHAILKRGGAHSRPQLTNRATPELKNDDGQEKKSTQQPQSSWLKVLRNPVLLSLMLCNSLSFGASKCTTVGTNVFTRNKFGVHRLAVS